ncbi:CPBP family intramembrane metalloprotease [Paenibacillus alvei]|uniref:CPBP family intramembrane glutamic endopeptidase n=1 Tax=Paenibacillus alvei TaxID=44250 RepID=UPI000288B432|nr:CPBP family intramembrane glutamic endopeptidase [Paenibacillus alvei]EJW13842.1 abortive infection protein [Paenibacillus alvei DSM 29]MCY9545154.1 CPBP family intramembrane metalloprotease [Paenibacillus alvei]MCY9732967.1 CPBP family intramembrane metalloprotease [Paenibacillus alvei]MEC0080255.1 CPBP family intramembrane metalloprotease [Paenibacillus alvei]
MVSKRIVYTALICAFVFITFQILIPSQQVETSPSFTKEEAIDKAIEFIHNSDVFKGKLQLNDAVRPTVIYQSNSSLTGYLDKHQLFDQYEKWGTLAPYDAYEVLIDAKYDDKPSIVKVFVHMKTGKIIGFRNDELSPSATSNLGEGRNANNNHISNKVPLTAILGVTEAMGWGDYTTKLQDSSIEDNDMIYNISDGKVGDATLALRYSYKNGEVIAAEPLWILPDSYLREEQHQSAAASLTYNFVHVLMSILLSAYTLLTYIRFRKSIRFGSITFLLLACISCTLSLVHIWSMLPSSSALRYQLPIELIDMNSTMMFQYGVTILQSLLLYLSLHTGKYLWDSNGSHTMCLKWSDPPFGKELVRSFICGLTYAGILLGLQAIIYWTFSVGGFTWSSTNAAQSPINLRLSLLLPFMAWVAAISEEGIYRYLGTALFMKWFKNPFVAGIIPTMIWAAGHATYPIYPFYVRPIEAFCLGLVFLYIMIKHNWWTAMFAHLMLDTFIMNLPGFLEGSISSFIWSSIAIVIPGIVVFLFSKLHLRLSNKRAILNNGYK